MITAEGQVNPALPFPAAASGFSAGPIDPQSQLATYTSSQAAASNPSNFGENSSPLTATSWSPENSQVQSAAPAVSTYSGRPGTSVHRQMLAKSAMAYGLGGLGGQPGPAPLQTAYGYSQPNSFNASAVPSPHQHLASPPAPYQPPYQQPYSHPQQQLQQPAYPPVSTFNNGSPVTSMVDPLRQANLQPAIQRGFVSGSSSMQPACMAPQPQITAPEANLQSTPDFIGESANAADTPHPNGCNSDRLRRKSGGWNDPPLLSSSTNSRSSSALSAKPKAVSALQTTPTAAGITGSASAGPGAPVWSPYPPSGTFAAPPSFQPASPPFGAPLQPQPQQPGAVSYTYQYASPNSVFGSPSNANSFGHFYASPTQ